MLAQRRTNVRQSGLRPEISSTQRLATVRSTWHGQVTQRSKGQIAFCGTQRHACGTGHVHERIERLLKEQIGPLHCQKHSESFIDGSGISSKYRSLLRLGKAMRQTHKRLQNKTRKIGGRQSTRSRHGRIRLIELIQERHMRLTCLHKHLGFRAEQSFRGTTHACHSDIIHRMCGVHRRCVWHVWALFKRRS